MDIAIIDIAIAKGPSSGQVPADPDRYDLTQLIKQIIELSFGHSVVKIPNIQRGRDELVHSIACHPI